MNLPINAPKLPLPDAEGTDRLVGDVEDPCACGCPAKAHRIDQPDGSAVWHGCMACDDCEGYWR
jgi:hypothetical protein